MRHPDSLLQHHLSLLLVTALLLSLAVLVGCDASSEESGRDLAVDADPQLGEALIQQYGCPACHTIPGVAGADGVVGPPLTFWADRVYIAGLLTNNADNLMHFIQNPQEVVPGGAMPDMGVTEDDARHIAAYLYTLRRRALLDFGQRGARDPLGRPAPGGDAAGTEATATTTTGQEDTSAVAPSPTGEDTGDGQTIEVIARNYEFEPATITVKAGSPTRFVVTSEDIYHTFTVKRSEDAEEDLFSLEIEGGETVSGTYTFEETGSYYLYCIPHEAQGMTGTIEVTQGGND